MARLLKGITQEISLPLYKGIFLNTKDRTVEGSAVLFQDHAERILATKEQGALALPQDQQKYKKMGNS